MPPVMLPETETFPFLDDGFQGLACSIKTVAADFEVEEVPAYEPCGEGDHTFLWIEKKGISTMQAVREFARQFGIAAEKISTAGLKDARALTRQWVSVETRKQTLPVFAPSEDLKILKTSLHKNKLRIGHLRGNRFRIKLRNTGGATLDMLRMRAAQLDKTGIPNYYGMQRFGMHGNNWIVGRALVQKDFSGAEKIAGPHKIRQKKMAALYVNAFQSWMFNQTVAARIHDLGILKSGDLAYKHDNGAVFPVTDPALEQHRAGCFEISPSGPVFGHKMTEASGEVKAMEDEIIAKHGVKPEDFGEKAARRMPGERRPLRIRPADLGVTEGNDADGHFFELSFSLPSGCYATSLLREIAKEKLDYAEK